MDKQTYVEAFRATHARYGRAVRRRHDWLFFWSDRRGVLRSDARLTEALLHDLRELDPPDGDAERIERELLAPIGEIVSLMQSTASPPHRRGRSEGSAGHTDFRRRLALMDFCVSYGLIDPPTWNLHATFPERVRESGLGTGPPDGDPPRLDDARRRRITRGSRGRSIGPALDSHPDPTWGRSPPPG